MPSATGQPLADSGRVRPLGLTGLKRAPAMPNVPTIAETGIKGLEATSWYGIFAPAKTPRAIVDTLQREIAKAVRSPDVAERLRQSGNEPVGGTTGEFAALVKADVARYAKVIEVAKVPRQ